MYQVVRGVADRDMQEKVLQAAAQVEGSELSLTRVTKLCEALEMGKQSQQLVNSASGSLNRMSAHQRKKVDGKVSGNKAPGNKSGGNQRGDGCGNCGSKGHSSRLSDQRENCKAFHESCNSCGTVGHYKAFCKGGDNKPSQAQGKDRDKSRDAKSKGKEGARVSEVKESESKESDEANLNTLNGSWLLMSGQQGLVGLGASGTTRRETGSRHQPPRSRVC